MSAFGSCIEESKGYGSGYDAAYAAAYAAARKNIKEKIINYGIELLEKEVLLK